MPNLAPPTEIHVTEEWRTSASGLKCKVFRADPTDVTIVPCLLEDALGRHEAIELPRSTVLVLAPVGVIGEHAYDPTDKKFEGRYVYTHRVTLCHLDIARSVASILNDITRSSTGLLDAKGCRV